MEVEEEAGCEAGVVLAYLKSHGVEPGTHCGSPCVDCYFALNWP